MLAIAGKGGIVYGIDRSYSDTDLRHFGHNS
jgi:hypothetical protein